MKETNLSPKAIREQEALKASTARLRAERLALEEKARALEALVERKEKFVQHLQQVLAESQTERQAIEAEYQRIQNAMPFH